MVRVDPNIAIMLKSSKKDHLIASVSVVVVVVSEEPELMSA